MTDLAWIMRALWPFGAKSSCPPRPELSKMRKFDDRFKRMSCIYAIAKADFGLA